MARTGGSGRIDAAAVRAALSIVAVFRYYGVDLTGSGHERRAAICPACGARSRFDAVGVNPVRGVWHCYRCDAGGDALAAVAAFAGLDVVRDFGRVLELAAPICSVVPTIDAHSRTPRELWRDGLSARADAEDARAKAIARAAAIWPTLARDHARGCAYLAGRGLDASALIARDAVRFWADGSPAVALHDRDGAITNIVRRQIDPGRGPKVMGLRGCSTRGTLIGRAVDITGGTLAVLSEGVTDALAAVCLWPHGLVLGANGAGNMRGVARLAAERIVASGGGRIAITIDDDPVGVAAGRAALDEIARVGLERAAVEVPDLGDAHDLADAYAAGWRP